MPLYVLIIIYLLSLKLSIYYIFDAKSWRKGRLLKRLKWAFWSILRFSFWSENSLWPPNVGKCAFSSPKICMQQGSIWGGGDRPKGGGQNRRVTQFSAPKEPKILKSDLLLGKKCLFLTFFRKFWKIFSQKYPKNGIFGHFYKWPTFDFRKSIRDRTPGHPPSNRSLVFKYTCDYVYTYVRTSYQLLTYIDHLEIKRRCS